MSAALVERPLLVSPSLATTLGLEAALLYQLIAEWLPLLTGRENQGQQWFLIDKDQLSKQLPFWDLSKIEEVLRTLHDQGLIIIGAALMSNAQNIRLALPRSQKTDDFASVNHTTLRSLDNKPITHLNP